MYRIAVDIGGTFTDCVVTDARGRTTVAKAPTTPADPARGVLDAVAVAAEYLGLTLQKLLAQTRQFVHGSTIGTNTMIERTGARTGLVTTRGHEDTLLIGRVRQKVAGLSEREKTHASRLNRADPPLVPAELIRGVSERIDYKGAVIVTLDHAEAAAALEDLVGEGIESLAVSFLWSFLNPAHERAVETMARGRHPGLYVSLSADVAPILGEYERTVSTALNAYIGPRVVAYLENLEGALREHGYRFPPLLMQSSGGLASVAEIRAKPILTLDSGPVGGILGSRFYGRLYREPNIICTDVGGTSFDVGLICGGEPELEPEPVIAQYAYRMPKILVKSIGAGGGSIAWIDEMRILRVGPRSAGALPGPACYDQGGTEPTVADANLLLGYLNPDAFLGGRMKLDRRRAEAAIASVAQPLGMEPVEAAAGILEISNAQMADLIRKCTVEKGYDPRDFILLTYGGAGPTHAPFYSADVGVKRTCILSDSSAFSAFGMLTSDLLFTAQVSHLLRTPLDSKKLETMHRLLGALEQQVLGCFAGEGIGANKILLHRTVQMRYQMQVHELEIPIPSTRLLPKDAELLARRFERRYLRIYGKGSAYTEAGFEIVTFRVQGTCRIPSPRSVRNPRPVPRDPGAALKGVRAAYFDRRFRRTAIYDGARLRYGHRLLGPCIVERMGDTVVLPPKVAGVVDRFGNIILKG